MKRIKVLIADDHLLIRRGLRELLGLEETLEVVGEVSDGDEAVEAARLLKPHVVLMDLAMPRLNGVEATRQLQAEMPDIKVLVHTVAEGDVDLSSAIKAGARGYLLKTDQPNLLVQAIQYVAHGALMVSPAMATKLMGELKTEQPDEGEEEPSLSPRQQRILRLMATGASEKGIAVRLATTESSIKSQVSRILHKLHLVNRREAVEYARRAGLAGDGKKAAVEQDVSAGARDRLETPDVGTEPVGSPTTTEAEELDGVIELIISPPVEPRAVLKLYLWLQQVGRAVIGDITGSLGGDTLLNITIRQPISLGMLAELPIVTEVNEESYLGGTGTVARPLSDPGVAKIGVGRTKSRRFRLVLQPD